jgi:MoaA/NifB/PqqE/SkfB family radical SAM enzyme
MKIMNKNSIKRYAKIIKNTASRYINGISHEHDIRHLTFEVTNLCNSKCEMCHIWANQEDDGQLTLDQIRTVFADPSLKRIEDVIITGGEAFLRDDIVEIVEAIWAVNGKTSITLSTNGILVEKILDVAKKLAAKRIPITYGISLDGVGELHDKRRRIQGNFNLIDKEIIPGLKQIRGNQKDLIKIGIGHCLDEYGYTTFSELKKYCEQNEIGFMTQLIEDFDYYLPTAKQDRSRDNWQEIHLIKKGFEGENRVIKKDIYLGAKDKYINLIDGLPPSVHHFRVINVLQGKDSRYECSSMRNFFLLRYDGAVTPCLRFCTKEIGNVKHQTLTHLLNSDSRKKAVEEILKCEGCLNTWCTDWSMEQNMYPFKNEAFKWLQKKILSNK